jgi:hypothetical protein
MTQDEFNKAVANFNGREPMRAKLYYSALRLIDNGFRVEAHLLILATWNFARFRYVTRTFDLEEYQRTLDRLTKLLSSLDGCELMDCDLKKHKTKIGQAFNDLACIEGIRFTGAAKILHLLYRHFFVMWDRFISGQYPKREYLKLEIVRSGFWPHRKFVCSGDGYYEFLEVCQNRFQGLVSPDLRRSLAKCIDEFNFTAITFPIAQALRALPDAG